ncbi:MAG: hypothetical protein AB7F22_16995 [Reyranella sp.]|uniref:hypothetical protein n=1 Tax=Reyranella sp. TaxID=1929291 RepID=UPI003D1042E1
MRWVDGYEMFATPLSVPTGTTSVSSSLIDDIPTAPGVDKAWFISEPPPLPNRGQVPEEWRKLYRQIEDNPVGGMDFRAPDAFRAWNARFAGDPCKHRHLHHAPGHLYLYDPPDDSARPPYRFLPNATMPHGLVTNQIGWRGAPIEEPRGDKTIRIVFVGASTTLDMPHLPYSWPEYAGYWLNVWAKAKGLPVRFEVLNAGRESIASTDIAEIVRTEVMPLRPDLIVYFEGGNQFRLDSVTADRPPSSAPRPKQAETARSWLQTASRYSALLGRVQAAIGAAQATDEGKEWPKPHYKVVWPHGLDEQNPDPNYPALPVNLNVILHDLDDIRLSAALVGSDFAVVSFPWMVRDGLVLDPVRHKYIIQQLNVTNYPYRYRDLERLARFQNRVLANYAKGHGAHFIDLASRTPLNPDLFVDAVHTNYAGGKLRGWIAFNLLLPIVEKHLADGSWPRTWPKDVPQKLPTFSPRKITFNCGQ